MGASQGARALPGALALTGLGLLIAAASAFGAETGSEYRRLFGADARIAVWIAAQLHLMLGAFVLGVPVFGVMLEVAGWRTGDERYDRLARELTSLLTTAFSATAAVGALFVFVLIALYPRVVTFLGGVFQGTLAVYALLVFAETVTLYLYIGLWDRLRGHWKAGHVALGVLLNLWGTLLLLLATAWTAYMMTPTGLDAERTRFVGTTWDAIANPLWIPLSIHRLVANVSFGGFVVGAYAAVRFLGASTDDERAHYDWMGYVGNLAGVAGMILLTFAGYYLGREVYSASPVMGNNMMGGAFSWTFIIQAALIGMLFVGANYYLWVGMERIPGAERYRGAIKYLTVALVAAFAVWLTPRNIPMTAEEQIRLGGQFHPVLKYFGLMPAKNAAVNLIILSTFLSFLLYRRANRGRPRPFATQRRGVLIGVGLAVAVGLGWYAVHLLRLDPRTLDLAPERFRYLLVPIALLFAEIAVVAAAGWLVRRDRATAAVTLVLGATAIFSVLVLGVWGFVVMERANPFLRHLAVVQWLLVMAAVVWCAAIDGVAFRGAATIGAIRWGAIPRRAQYALILLCVSIVLLMGLMGYVRSGLREDWHVYGVLRDTSESAWTPTNAMMARIVGGIVVLFLGIVAALFWLAGMHVGGAETAPQTSQRPAGGGKAAAARLDR
jgi:cytochrome bd-type quinol oxidase subunit 1